MKVLSLLKINSANELSRNMAQVMDFIKQSKSYGQLTMLRMEPEKNYL